MRVCFRTLCCWSLRQCATVWVEEDWNWNELLFYFSLPQDITRCKTLKQLYKPQRRAELIHTQKGISLGVCVLVGWRFLWTKGVYFITCTRAVRTFGLVSLHTLDASGHSNLFFWGFFFAGVWLAVPLCVWGGWGGVIRVWGGTDMWMNRTLMSLWLHLDTGSGLCILSKEVKMFYFFPTWPF